MGVESGETLEYGGLPGPGAVIAGKYRVDRVLAVGGMGTILAATHLTLEQRVAIKVLLPEVATKPEFVERFLREARASVGLRGEHAVRVFDVGTLGSGSPYMVMEYLRGHDLANEVSKRGPLPVEEAVDYVLQACEALAEAHQLGIIHRDLKPANLFLARQPDSSRRIKVLDFGISKRIQSRTTPGKDQGLTLTSTLLGSPQYMSPEQVRNVKTIDGRADIWALGIVLYELLTDATPFTGDTISAIAASVVSDQPYPLEKLRPSMPRALDAIVYRCLEKNPEDRFNDIPELVEALLPFAPEHARPSLDRVRNIARGPTSGGHDSDFPSVDSLPVSAPPRPLQEAETVAMPSGRPPRGSSVPPQAPLPLDGGTLASTPVGIEATSSRRKRNIVLVALALAGLLFLGILGLTRRAPEPAVSEPSSAAQASESLALPRSTVAPVLETPEVTEVVRPAPPKVAPAPAQARPEQKPKPLAAKPAPQTPTSNAATNATEPASLERSPAVPIKVNDPLDDRK